MIFFRDFLDPFMDETEYRRNKDKRGNSSDEKASNHCAAERSILFSTIAKPQRHWDHSDDHREGGHEDRAKTRTASLDRRDGLTAPSRTRPPECYLPSLHPCT